MKFNPNSASRAARCYSIQRTMTLQVDFEHFVAAIQRHLSTKFVYVCQHESRTLLTAADPEKAFVIVSRTRTSAEDAHATLKEAGLETAEGMWRNDVGSYGESFDGFPFIAAVSYDSEDEMPGVWVDAYPEMPTQAMVLKALFDEFRQTGEVGEVSFEEFVRQANPNVVIVSPTEVASFLDAKSETPCP